MNSPIVFLGPSLSLDMARTVLDAIYLPPCKMGDVLAAVQMKPSMIVIIDGLFEQTPAVWHKEILFALASGIPVLGGASMGALRAAELHSFGMVGIGKIFQDFADGSLEDDDEVAVGHSLAEHGFQSQTDAMVNLRHGLELAVEAQVIPIAIRELLIEQMKATHYAERSWYRVFELAEKMGVDEIQRRSLKNFLALTKPNLKRDDALAVLRAAAKRVSQAANNTDGVNFKFEPTKYWEHLISYFGPASLDSDNAVNAEQLISHIRLTHPERRTLRERALLLFLVKHELSRLGLHQADDRDALLRFRRERGLLSPESMSSWLREQCVSQEECLSMAQMEAALRSLAQHYAAQVDRNLKTVLKLEGQYAEALEQLETRSAALQERGISRLSPDDVTDMDSVIDWYQQVYGKLTTSLPEHAQELGFSSFEQFLPELLAEYVLGQRQRESLQIDISFDSTGKL